MTDTNEVLSQLGHASDIVRARITELEAQVASLSKGAPSPAPTALVLPAAPAAPLPKWYQLALAERGIQEGPGPTDNPRVLAYYRDAGHLEIAHDAVPWCAAFVGAMLSRAGVKPSGQLNARSYLDWGRPLSQPARGCVVVFSRGGAWQGHVTFFDHWIANAPGTMVCLGGNQNDQVCFEAFSTRNVLGYRWPK